MQTTKEGLENELHQELMTTLSSSDQNVVDNLEKEDKEVFSTRLRLEAKEEKLKEYEKWDRMRLFLEFTIGSSRTPGKKSTKWVLSFLIFFEGFLFFLHQFEFNKHW